MSTLQQPLSIDVDRLLAQMLEKLQSFQTLLTEEQQAIRTLSFGHFATVLSQKTQLLDEIRELEQQRRAMTPSEWAQPASPERDRQEALLVAAVEATDRMNRFNGALIGQSLQFLEGSLRLWQRSPESAALYTSAGRPTGEPPARVHTTG